MCVPQKLASDTADKDTSPGRYNYSVHTTQRHTAKAVSISAADIIALKVNSLITQNRATRLEKLSTATSKQLWVWDAVNKSRHHNADNGSLLLMRDPDAINDFFC